MSWLFLAIGIVCEVASATLLRISDGFTKLVPTVAALTLSGASLLCVAVVVRKIDLGVTYTIWAGSGTVLIALVGIFYFQEPATLLRAVSIAFVIVEIIGLRMSA